MNVAWTSAVGGSHFDLQNKPKVVNRLLERLTSLGYPVTLCPASAPAPVNFRQPDTVLRESTPSG